MSSETEERKELAKVAPSYDLTDNIFKIAVIKKFSEFQENSERQFNMFSNKINVKESLNN